MHTHSQARCCLSFPSSTTFEWHFQIGSKKKKSERQILFLLTTYFTSALSCCLVTKKEKKDTPIALETVTSVSHFCGRSEQVTDQWLKLWKNGWQRNRRPTGSHLFLHTFDSQIFTVLSLETKGEREVGWWAVENQDEHNKGEKITEHQSGTPAFKTSHCTSDTTQRHELQRTLRTHTHRLH